MAAANLPVSQKHVSAGSVFATCLTSTLMSACCLALFTRVLLLLLLLLLLLVGIRQGLWRITSFDITRTDMIPELLCVIDDVDPAQIGDIAMLHTGDLAVSVRGSPEGHADVAASRQVDAFLSALQAIPITASINPSLRDAAPQVVGCNGSCLTAAVLLPLPLPQVLDTSGNLRYIPAANVPVTGTTDYDNPPKCDTLVLYQFYANYAGYTGLSVGFRSDVSGKDSPTANACKLAIWLVHVVIMRWHL